jgi:hypothetical protein
MAKAGFVLFSAALLAIAADTAIAEVRGCPAGTALQGIDFSARKVICTPVVGAGALKVVDAQGAEVGLFTGSQSLARLVGNEWISLPFNANGFVGAASLQNLFEAADCSGRSYIGDPGPVVPRSGPLLIQGSYLTVYLPTSPLIRTIRSYGDLTAAGVVNCTSLEPTDINVTLPDVRTIPAFASPFRVAQ